MAIVKPFKCVRPNVSVVDKVAAVRTSPNDKPLTPVVINTITIED